MKESLKKNQGVLVWAVLFSVAASVMSVLIAIFLQRIIDVAMSRDLEGFYRVIVLSVVYLLAVGGTSYLSELFSKLFLRNLTRRLRERVFLGVMRRNDEDFSSVNTAEYISSLTNDVKLVEENYILPLLLVLQHGVAFAATLVLLLWFSPLVTAVLVGCMAIMFTVPSLLGKALQSRQDALSVRLSGFTTRLKDIFSGYEVIRSYRMTDRINQEFDKENKETADSKFAADKLFVLNQGLSQMLATWTQMVSIFVAAYLVITDQITVGTLIALVQLGSSFVWPVVTIMQNIPKIKGIKPVIQRLEEYSDYKDQSFHGSAKPHFEQELTAKGVFFGYDQDRNVLDGLNLTLKKGCKYAIAGASGCGKTTLIRLLTGCYAGYRGSISFDGADLRDLEINSLREMISVIHQNVYMFDQSIRENICLGREFSSTELESALERSGVKGFLSQLPNGLDSPAGENGANLSGGQRQRIAIARALIRKTPVVILDEGTSAIDMQTAYDIESRLLAAPDVTVITITHKMSSELLGKYDEVIFLEQGRVEEQGPLEDLLAGNGSFRGFFSLAGEA